MEQTDVIVVGGGPAGSTCAWKLRQAGLDVIVLDRAAFPRTKLCAGWVTPEAMADLQLDEDSYPYGFVTFETLYLHWKKLTVKHPSRQHSIRRVEFDDFLLQRSGAKLVRHQVREIVVKAGSYVIDDRFQCRYLVGAGGTRCPVYRTFFHDVNPRASVLQTATYEYEFEYDWQDENCHLWFFGDGLPGYSWYVPKADGHINVGLGGMAVKLRQRKSNVQQYWQNFVAMLDGKGLVLADDLAPTGYSYFLRGNVDNVKIDNACIIGDSVGLATVDLCEGIGPAVKSALLAADSIVSGGDYSVAKIDKYSGQSFVSKVLERQFIASQ